MTLQAKIVLLLILVFLRIELRAGGDHNGRGVRSVAMGTIGAVLTDDVWNVRHNPAGLASLSHTKGNLFFVPQQFGLQELKTVALAAGVPFSFGTVGVGIDQFGFSLYRELTASIAFAHVIDWGVAAGIALHLHRFSIERYGSSQTISFDLGLAAEPFPKTRLGFNARNIGAATIGKVKDPLPQVFHVGAATTPVEGFWIGVEAEKDIRFPTSVKVGIEQVVFEFLSLRVGVANNPEKLTAGFEVRYSLFDVGYAGYSHPFLGWTHQIEVGVRLE